jgi:hypothetical protein
LGKKTKGCRDTKEGAQLGAERDYAFVQGLKVNVDLIKRSGEGNL